MFKDHFSKQSDLYAEHRPTYPSELFEYLAKLAPGNDIAWDCATGNGQAAIELAKNFKTVIASDASETQIENAQKAENIKYVVSNSERINIKSNTVDLITVAQAIHWFNFEAFFKEAERTLKQSGVIAAWTYGVFQVDQEVDRIISYFYKDIVGKFWPPERRHVENGYSDIVFPFNSIETPRYFMERKWSRTKLLNYLDTWSSVQRYKDNNNSNPLELIYKDLESIWPDENEQREITWEISLKIGRK